MNTKRKDIIVYAHWQGILEPKKIGILSSQQAKGRKSFSFTYDNTWLHSKEQYLIDPDISWHKGSQYPNGKENFGVFLDSMPDTWGRTLMKRRAALEALENNKPAPVLHDTDFLLGVFDETRMGALRFKTDENGPFLDNNNNMPTPPWSSLRELQQAVEIIESDKSNKAIKKWLKILIAPGSSLGGARPKANIKSHDGNLWIAKFPSKNDNYDKAAWEFLAYQLAIKCGIEMADSRIEKISGLYHTFFTKRFDRIKNDRIHFASAMTMTGNNEETIKLNPASYLDLAELIQYHGAQNRKDLAQLWKRIVFNISVSNTDDHLRNHGFLLTPKGWILSPAYDINPSIDKDGLALNIDSESNQLDIELAKSVGEYFHLTNKEMDSIIKDIIATIKNWHVIAKSVGISKKEQELMRPAFRY